MDIQVEHVDFSYQDTQVLTDITASFKKGLFHAILGPNGSGKTTLLDLLSGYVRPGSGKILLDDTPLNRLNRQEIAKAVALVSQSYEINFPFTVNEVVLMGRHPYMDRFSTPDHQDCAKAEEAMTDAGIFDLKNNLVTELSGGEKQRCVFARALCQDTPVLLLDEAFSSMDINHTLNLLKVLKDRIRTKGITVISVLHDLNLAAGWSDTMLFLKSGSILTHGDADQVFTDETIRSVFNVTAKVEYNDFLRAKQASFRP